MTIVSQKTMDKLKAIGLNLYERKLYAALLARGTSTAGELSEMAVVPRSRSYDVLESLAEKGFVIIKNAKPLQYVAVSPSEALDRAKNKMKTDLADAIERIEEFKASDALSELQKLHSSGVNLVDAADMSGSLKGRHSIHQQLGTMLKAADSNIDILTSENGLKELNTKHADLIKAALDKGVNIRIAAPISAGNKSDVETLKALGSKIAIRDISRTNVPTTRMFVVNGNASIIGLTDDVKTHPTQDVAFWSASEHFSQNFAKPTFDLIWEKVNKRESPEK